jgi:ornithine carbamoyltransferase
MSSKTQPCRFLRVADLDPKQLHRMLDLAAAMKQQPKRWRGALAGESFASIFERPSTRARVSLAAAAFRLGMLPISLRPDELQDGRGDPVVDTARVLSGYVAAIAVRTHSHGLLERIAAAATVPVINALSDEHHPCQALADLLTLREHFGGLSGLKLAYIGDGNNVAHSLLEAAALAGMAISVASSPGHEPDAEVVACARAIAEATGAEIETTSDPEVAVAGAHAVYTDAWVSLGAEGEREQQWRRELVRYRVDGRLMARARPDAVFLHCLPARGGEEATDDTILGPASLGSAQAGNCLPVEQALLYTLLAGEMHAGASEAGPALHSADGSRGSRSSETVVIVRHHVEDFQRWKRVFDANEDARLRHGGRGHRILRSLDDPNELMVVIEFASRGGAVGFLGDPAFIYAIRDGGVRGGAHHKQWTEELHRQVESVRYTR